MHIILGLLTVLGIAAFAISRVLNAADDARAAARRFTWTRKTHKRPIDDLGNPMEAGAILVTQIALYEGDLAEDEKRNLIDRFKTEFELDDASATELLGFARFAIQQSTDAANVLSRIVPVIDKACDIDERKQLIAMMTAVARYSGEPSPIQQQLIDRVTRGLLGPQSA